ncbi:MAG: ATP-binding protein, partial [Chloroflexota bacterium]
YAQILQGDVTLSPAHQEMIASIRGSGEHLLAIINDILDLSKIEAGRLELYPTEFNLPNFLRSIVDMFQLRAAQKGIVFYDKLTPALPEVVRADAKLLRQILLNLLSNAVKFTHTGSVTFTVKPILPARAGLENKVTPQAKASMRPVRFEVTDTGIGITPDDLAKIFEPFRQVGVQAHFAEGTGLGLAISQHGGRLMGAQIKVESVVGRGSRFWFDLDLECLEPAEGDAPASPASRARIIGYKGEVQKILVVDDDPVNRKMLRKVFEPLGFTVMEAVDGLAGLEALEQFRPQLALIDLVMPNLDGLELIRRARRSARGTETVLIAISASAFKETRAECFAVGGDDFLTKPIEIGQLLGLLEKYLPLDWIYEKDKATPSAPDTAPIVLPPAHAVAALYELALDGDVGSLLQQLDNLAHTDPQLEPFIARLRQQARQYRLDVICELLERYL